MFDPQTFMDATINDALDTKVTPCPVGEFPGLITALKAKSGTIANGERAGQEWGALDVTIEIEDAGAKSITGRDKVFSHMFVMLDLTPEGMLDLGKGKNVKLGKLRDAVGLNVPGQTFSFPMMVGQRLIAKVSHRPDEKDPSILYDEVTAVRKI